MGYGLWAMFWISSVEQSFEEVRCDLFCELLGLDLWVSLKFSR